MLRPPLPQAEFEAIFAKVPRLTVEVIITGPKGVWLTYRDAKLPCGDMWHFPGGTVRFGEHATDAVHRVAGGELASKVEIDKLLGYIEYPTHLQTANDWPVGLAFQCHVVGDLPAETDTARWYKDRPPIMHDEQFEFLRSHHLI